jgi:hypothetical protein
VARCLQPDRVEIGVDARQAAYGVAHRAAGVLGSVEAQQSRSRSAARGPCAARDLLE